MQEELAELMGSEHSEINLKGSPAVILIAGLQGSGKTTFAGKLALLLKSKKNKRPLLVACDVYRPAAIDQIDRKSTRLNSSHALISYAVFCLKKKKPNINSSHHHSSHI